MTARVTHATCIAPARVGTTPMTRHAFAALEGGTAFAVVGALSAPRLWEFAIDAALNSILIGLARSRASRGPERLQEAFSDCRRHYAEHCSQLIERHAPDAALAVVLLEGRTVHALGVGPCRAYLTRPDEHRRLTPRREAAGGILRAQPAASSVELSATDRVIIGTVTAFSVRGVARVAGLLKDSPDAAPKTVADMLCQPAKDVGSGAAAAVLNVA